MQSIEASIGSLTPKLQVSFSDVVIFTHNFSKYSKCRSSRPEVFYRNGVLRNFAKFTEKHLCQSFFFNKVATLLKKRIWHRCFPVNFAKFLRTPFFTEILWWLLLNWMKKLAVRHNNSIVNTMSFFFKIPHFYLNNFMYFCVRIFSIVYKCSHQNDLL